MTAPIDTDQQKAAQQLEAFFLRRLLAEARPQGGMLDGGFAGDTFKQMLDEAIADKMAGAGGLGMAEMFARQLGGTGAARAMPVPAGVLAPIAPAQPAFELPPGQMAMPVVGRLSSGYGMRTDPVNGGHSMHAGLDVAAPAGTPVVAAAAGTVTHAGPAGTYGNLVTIRHANGLETRYAHLAEVGVAKGAEVVPGAPIGTVGSTGKSTGPHLHFEVREDGKAVDPRSYLPLNDPRKQPSR